MPADRPTTAAGQRLVRLNREKKWLLERDYLVAILAIEAEARQPDSEALREALANHYVTAVECDHEAKTDTIRCSCSIWTGTPQSSVGAAVQQWIGHVLAALPRRGV